MFSAPVLAHGALGVYDELIFATVALFFIVMMGLSWWKSRAANDEDALPLTDGPADAPHAQAGDTPEHFRLD